MQQPQFSTAATKATRPPIIRIPAHRATMIE
jgi:hypothetical protein